MSDCCCGDNKKKTVLIYACSGGANVAEISDKAARQLMFEGQGSMFCLAGLGAGIQGMIQTAKDADVNLVIDGCPMDCAKKVFEKAGITKSQAKDALEAFVDSVTGSLKGGQEVRLVGFGSFVPVSRAAGVALVKATFWSTR